MCAGLSDGGLTPSAALIEAAAELAEVHVLVLQQLARNWDGSDFRLHHFEAMDFDAVKAMGCDSHSVMNRPQMPSDLADGALMGILPLALDPSGLGAWC